MRFARIIVEDGDVSDAEAAGLQAWIESNPDVKGLPQVEQVLDLLRNVLDDGHITDEERAELADALERFGG